MAIFNKMEIDVNREQVSWYDIEFDGKQGIAFFNLNLTEVERATYLVSEKFKRKC